MVYLTLFYIQLRKRHDLFSWVLSMFGLIYNVYDQLVWLENGLFNFVIYVVTKATRSVLMGADS